MMDQRMERLLAQNRSAVRDFGTAASALSPEVWATPIAPGKWTPAQHVEHVGRAYAAAVDDLVHNAPMRLIGTPRQRRWWRLLGLTAVRLLGRLPHGAPAPREIRPSEERRADQPELLSELDERVRSFEEVVRTSATTNARGFTHPYFGALSLRDGVRLAAVHTRHHERALLGALRAAAAHSAGR
jgi:hypothetical protein